MGLGALVRLEDRPFDVAYDTESQLTCQSVLSTESLLDGTMGSIILSALDRFPSSC